MKDTLLLTGSSGFIGSNIVNSLSDNYKLVLPIRKGSLDKLHVIDSGMIKIVEGEFYDKDVLDETFSQNIDTVIHLAALRGETDKPWEEYKRINVDATEILLEYSKKYGIKKFIYCSSVGVWGTIPENQPTRYSDKVNPDNYYHQSKWLAEELVRKNHSKNFQICIIRPTITYGNGDDGFLPKLISLVKKNHFILPSKPVYIHLVNVKSLANLIKSICQSSNLDGGTYIAADQSPVRLSEIVNRIYQIYHGRNYPSIYYLPNFIFGLGNFALSILKNKRLLTSLQLISQSWTYDIDETIKLFGYKPVKTLEEIDDIIKCY